MKCWFRTCLVLICCLLSASAVDGKTVRIATFNIQNGPDVSGSSDYNATRDVLKRINADIVGFQEVLSTNEANWRSIAQELNYPHVAFGTNRTSMSGNQRLGYFSRFPITQTNAVIYLNEVTRVPLNVVIQVPGAAKPLVVWNMHHKADDTENPHVTYTNRNNQLRRAVETLRIVQSINAYRSNNPTHDEFVMLGDLNDDISEATARQAIEFTEADYALFKTVPGLLPSSFVIGPDIQFPISYRSFPDDRYAAAGGGLHCLDLRQQDGNSRGTRPVSGRTLDYLFVSTALLESPLGAPRGEVYNSEHDASFVGLAKAGQILAAETSLAASDHLAVFADIEMDNALMFAPAAGAPGSSVLITGLLPAPVSSVRFGGVEATDFTVESDTQVSAIVPPGATTGPITVTGPEGEASSATDFLVTVLPTIASALPSSSSLTNFGAVAGAVSAAQSFTVSAAGMGGPLLVSAPTGFEVSLDGTNFSTGVAISAPPRSDAASSYAGSWTSGSTGGNGFGAWEMYVSPSNGQAEAYLGSPASSGVQGMAASAFALRAGPQNSGANVYVWRSLQQPLAVGEAISFDWGINWDSDNTNNGGKGFIIASGSAGIVYVGQRGFPGHIQMWHNNTVVDTGIAYGTIPMRWTFRQINGTNLNVTATARTNSTTIAFSTNITVPGAVNSFWWYADRMDTNANRISYYNNLNIVPIAPGGGSLSMSNVFVRLASNAPVGNISGAIGVSSGGQALASVALNGLVIGPGAAYEAWVGSYGLDPAGDGAPGEDKDGDRYSNWLEFAFGTTPVAPDGTLVGIRHSSDGVTFEFLRRKTRVTYVILHTASLAAPFAAASGLDVAASSNQAGVPDGWERATFTVPGEGAGFYRISVSPN